MMVGSNSCLAWVDRAIGSGAGMATVAALYYHLKRTVRMPHNE